MSDIFISYSRSNQKWVEKLAFALEESGYDVWWDTELLAGDAFHNVIPAELEKAKCVLVVWSKTSITRTWVRAEASRGDDRGVLVPILMETVVNLPMPFNMLQTEDMTHWNGNSNHDVFKRLLQAVNRHCEQQVILDKKKPSSLKKNITIIPFLTFLFFGGGLFFENFISQKNTDQYKVLSLLHSIEKGEIVISDIEKLELYKSLYILAKEDQEKYQHTCPTTGTYLHAVSSEDSLTSIIKGCDYSVQDSNFLTKNTLNIDDIVSILIDDEKMITQVSVFRQKTNETSVLYSNYGRARLY